MEVVPCPTVRDVLDESKGVLRLEELLTETAMDELPARQALDEIVLAGEVERTPVGNHVMVRCTDEFTAPEWEEASAGSTADGCSESAL
jgi:hypothetical protein